MKPTLRLGLRGELMLLLALVIVLVLGLFYALWQLEYRSNHEVRERTSAALRDLAREGLQRRGETLSSQLADAATNPLYYLDLAKLGELARSALRQPDVAYVIVYDAEGS